MLLVFVSRIGRSGSRLGRVGTAPSFLPATQFCQVFFEFFAQLYFLALVSRQVPGVRPPEIFC